MRKPVSTPHVLWIFEELFGIEIADLSPNFTIVFGRIKSVDSSNAADAVLQIRLKRLNAVANRRDKTHTGDDYSALGHYDITLRLKPGSVSWFPCRRFAQSGRVFLPSGSKAR